jgi:hypothetical protein
MKTQRLVRSALVLVCLPALLAGCGGEGGGDGDTPPDGSPPGDGDTPPDKQQHTFVMDSLIVPATAAEAVSTYGLDIDGKENDADRGVDNQLGRSFVSLADMADIGAAVKAGVDNGSIIMLVDVRTPDLATNARVEVGIYLGANPVPAACENDQDQVCRRHLDGSASFELAPDAPTDTVLTGSLASGGFTMSAEDAPGRVAIPFPALDGGEPVVVEMVGARISIQTVSETGLTSGILGGAIPADDFENTVLPSFHQGLAAQVAADCTGTSPTCCTPDSGGEGILDFFDPGSADCMVSFEEFRGNFFLSFLLNPDVDLFDAEGNYNPNSDGANDSLSLGLGFSAVTATFPAP